MENPVVNDKNHFSFEINSIKAYDLSNFILDEGLVEEYRLNKVPIHDFQMRYGKGEYTPCIQLFKFLKYRWAFEPDFISFEKQQVDRTALQLYIRDHEPHLSNIGFALLEKKGIERPDISNLAYHYHYEMVRNMFLKKSNNINTFLFRIMLSEFEAFEMYEMCAIIKNEIEELSKKKKIKTLWTTKK